MNIRSIREKIKRLQEIKLSLGAKKAVCEAKKAELINATSAKIQADASSLINGTQKFNNDFSYLEKELTKIENDYLVSQEAILQLQKGIETDLENYQTQITMTEIDAEVFGESFENILNNFKGIQENYVKLKQCQMPLINTPSEISIGFTSRFDLNILPSIVDGLAKYENTHTRAGILIEIKDHKAILSELKKQYKEIK